MEQGKSLRELLDEIPLTEENQDKVMAVLKTRGKILLPFQVAPLQANVLVVRARNHAPEILYRHTKDVSAGSSEGVRGYWMTTRSV